MNTIEFGDCRAIMRQWDADGIKAQTCVTSPPYFGLRDYGHEGQIGLEQTPEEYIDAMVDVFRCVRDVLADDGTLWLNIGDSYDRNKNRRLIPARVAIAMQFDGWLLRDEIVWHKPRTTPSPVVDRTCAAHEMIYMFTKSPKYYYDYLAIEEASLSAGKTVRHVRGQQSATPGVDAKYAGRDVVVRDTRRKRSVWSVSPSPYKGAHFATFPTALIEPCILAGSRVDDIVLDPFMGSGTTAQVAIENGRQYLGCELNSEYKALQDERIGKAVRSIEMQNAQEQLF